MRLFGFLLAILVLGSAIDLMDVVGIAGSETNAMPWESSLSSLRKSASGVWRMALPLFLVVSAVALIMGCGIAAVAINQINEEVDGEDGELPKESRDVSFELENSVEELRRQRGLFRKYKKTFYDVLDDKFVSGELTSERYKGAMELQSKNIANTWRIVDSILKVTYKESTTAKSAKITIDKHLQETNDAIEELEQMLLKISQLELVRGRSIISMDVVSDDIRQLSKLNA